MEITNDFVNSLMQRAFLFGFITLLYIAFVACDNATSTESELQEERSCYEARVIELPSWMGCRPTIEIDPNRVYLHRLVLEGHHAHDTIFTLLAVDKYDLGEDRLALRLDSMSDLWLRCNTLGSIDHPQYWSSELLEANCED